MNKAIIAVAIFSTLATVQTICKPHEYSLYNIKTKTVTIAEVITSSGTYSVEVDVDGNTVRCVQWGNGGCMSMFGAVLDSNGYASGENRRGQSIEIHVER